MFLLGNAGIIISFLFCYFWAGLSLDVGSVTILLRIFELLENALYGIAESITRATDVFVSMRRLTLFLESKELEFGEVKQEANPDSLYAVEIKNGSFYWDKRISKEDSEKNVKEKTEGSEGDEKEKKDQKDDDFVVSASSELRKTLLTTATDETTQNELEEKENENGPDHRFELEDLNFRAERGKLTVIIGKIGSGKS